MINHERAEKILLKGECGETTWSEDYREELKAFITSQLDEAVEEATEYGMWHPHIDVWKQAEAQGFATARDQAAGIAENYVAPRGRVINMEDNCGIAERIRAMKAE